MENASKALIIAGAILLSILIITLGIIVYRQAAGTVNQINLNEQEIASINERFTRFEGTSVTGANVNALIQQVITYDQAAYTDKTGAYVGIVFPTSSDASGNTQVQINVSTHNTGGVSYADLTGPNKLTSVQSVTDSQSTDAKSSSNNANRVATGKTYTVTFGYSDRSIVNKIFVKANS